jgi:tetrahydromethanopterin S-methyltransferase subunit B
VLKTNAGTVNYETGEVIITDMLPTSIDASDDQIRVSVEPDTGIITTVRNQLILLDSEDASSIIITIRFR